ncbi:MAG: helix-turn-helix transcriptional regulator [Clostridia bacterium]|nr:helix-turn-helix transcriptional regulator [Clostridia bacterium]
MINITSIRHTWPSPPGFCLNRPNGHPDYTFVHFITSVELRLNGKSVIAPEHSCIIYKPSTPQYFLCPKGMLHDWFHFNGVSEQLFSDLDIPTDVLILPKQWSFITELVEEIETEFYGKRNYSEPLIDLKINELFIKIGRALKGEYSKITDKEITYALRQLRIEISQNLSQDWTVSKMARKLMLSQSRFAHIYQNFYGTTPIEDVIRMRILSAKNALEFTQSTICEISYSLGYRNTTHFCRQFRQFVGISPSQYRKNCN